MAGLRLTDFLSPSLLPLVSLLLQQASPPSQAEEYIYKPDVPVDLCKSDLNDDGRLEYRRYLHLRRLSV